jgi:hypothetical protein
MYGVSPKGIEPEFLLLRQPGSIIGTFARILPEQFAKWSTFSKRMVALIPLPRDFGVSKP